MPVELLDVPDNTGLYSTTALLRTQLGVDFTVLSNTAATVLLSDACEIIDRLLGGWYPDEATGRKIDEDDVEAWQWAKLQRATTLLAARLHGNSALVEQFWSTVSGPDFSRSGPAGGSLARILGVQTLALLDNSGLRRLAGRAHAGGAGRRMKPGYQRFLDATLHNGT